MCLFTSARTVAIVFARSAGSEAMYCAGVLTLDPGFMDSSSSRTKCITERLKTSPRQGCESLFVAWTGAIGSLPTWRMRKLDAFVILVPEELMVTWSELSNGLHKTIQTV